MDCSSLVLIAGDSGISAAGVGVAFLTRFLGMRMRSVTYELVCRRASFHRNNIISFAPIRECSQFLL